MNEVVVKVESKVCATCQCTFYRKPTDSHYMFNLRKYCSQKCAAAAQRRNISEVELIARMEAVQKLAHADLERFRQNGVKTDDR